MSIVAPDELAVVAERMGLAEVRPEWIGANLLLDGIPHLSMLPPGTLLFFKGGATLKIDAQNGPCRIARRQVAIRAGMADQAAGSLLFRKVAKRLRGLVAWVEKPGTLTTGEDVSVRVPEQWIYKASGTPTVPCTLNPARPNDSAPHLRRLLDGELRHVRHRARAAAWSASGSAPH